MVEPALLEVNGLSDVAVQAKLVRAHPRAPITAVTLAWWRKEGDAFRATYAEHQQPKQGRAARLRNMAPVTPPNPPAAGKPRRGRPPKAAQATAPTTAGQQLDLVDALAAHDASDERGQPDERT